MSIRAFIHLEYENPVIKIGENCEDDLITIPLYLGDDAVVFVAEDQLEDLINKSCEKLYKKTYSDLEDEIFNLQDDFDNLSEQNERLIEQAVGE